MTRGSIWWVEFDPAVGSEIRKTRPAIIVSNNIANQHLSRVVVVPVTSNTSRVYPGEAIVTVNGTQNKAMSDQIMSADKSRLKSKIGILSDVDILSLETALKEFLYLSS
ncbi:type II toxin-antitoxin system PemK/MazF family toxin [Treponema primitia]|uniref:type II toxin-antitoxin system PemK/MazF family toxin n=1 Tax=Treponema primitia TaxID=88058 RepID=UPI0002555408|nr:type II toxin-antitoxin system PemK/MazF family toxin [Treponema primitia]